jgi:hypothetical protein
VDPAQLSDEQVQHQWQRIAARAHTLIERSGSPRGFAVASGSPLSGDDAAANPYRVSDAAQVCLVSAIDHLHALCALVLHSGYLHATAPFTLARGVLETAAAAVWMLCPAGRDDRVRRALQWNAKDIADGDRAARSAGVPVPVSLQERMDKLEVVAARRGLDFAGIRRGYTSSEAVKAAEEHLDTAMGVLFPWQFASGHAHGRRWNVLGVVQGMHVTPAAEPGVSTLRIEGDYRLVLYPAWAAEEVVSGAVQLFDRRAAAP